MTEKYAKTLMFRGEEITALRKLVAWKKAEREILMTVRKKYESYCKFDDEILSEFKGAARSPSTKNEPGLLLEKYVKSVVADTVTEGSVKAITVGNIIQVDQELIANSDVIVCHIKAVPSVAAENLMTLACSRAKDVIEQSSSPGGETLTPVTMHPLTS